jgi:hypothetical protein
VPNLTHPGGNITGFANPEFSIAGKWADLLKQMAPSIARGGPWPFGPRGTWRPKYPSCSSRLILSAPGS